jgi:hypothetical protein
MVASSCSANEQTEVVRRSAVTREKGWEKEEGAGRLTGLDLAEIGGGICR